MGRSNHSDAPAHSLAVVVGDDRKRAGVCGWIEEVRGVRCGVVGRPGARPVPLRAAMLLPDKRLLPLFGENGKLNSEIAALGKRAGRETRTEVVTEEGFSVAQPQGVRSMKTQEELTFYRGRVISWIAVAA